MSEADEKKIKISREGLLTHTHVHTQEKKLTKMSRTFCTDNPKAFTPQQPFPQRPFKSLWWQCWLVNYQPLTIRPRAVGRGKVPLSTAVLIFEADCTWRVAYKKRQLPVKLHYGGIPKRHRKSANRDANVALSYYFDLSLRRKSLLLENAQQCICKLKV